MSCQPNLGRVPFLRPQVYGEMHIIQWFVEREELRDTSKIRLAARCHRFSAIAMEKPGCTASTLAATGFPSPSRGERNTLFTPH